MQHGGSFRKYPSRKNVGCGRWLDRNRNTTFSPKFVTFPVFVQVSRCWGLLPLLIVSGFPSVGGASPSLVFWQKQPAWPFRMKVVPHVEHLNKPTAYGDGLRGLRNTDVTDAHGSFITDLLFFLFFSFDGPLGLRILNGFSAYQASPVMWHTSIHITLRLRKIRVDLPRRRRDLCY